jgi:PBP superfamily domain
VIGDVDAFHRYTVAFCLPYPGPARHRAVNLARPCSPGNRAGIDHVGRGLRAPRSILPLITKTTGIEVRVVAQGTGQALETARRGDADLVLVHDPEAEQKFISEGYGIDRRQIAWNDFVIVGPDADPAHIKVSHDAVARSRR